MALEINLDPGSSGGNKDRWVKLFKNVCSLGKVQAVETDLYVLLAYYIALMINNLMYMQIWLGMKEDSWYT